jgi:hypothetical protein
MATILLHLSPMLPAVSTEASRSQEAELRRRAWDGPGCESMRVVGEQSWCRAGGYNKGDLQML